MENKEKLSKYYSFEEINNELKKLEQEYLEIKTKTRILRYKTYLPNHDKLLDEEFYITKIKKTKIKQQIDKLKRLARNCRYDKQ